MQVDFSSITGKKSKIDKGTFEVYPFTPVFVGSGDTLIRNLDFISQSGNTHIIDLHKLFSACIDDIAGLEQAVSKQSLKSYMDKRNLDITDFTKRIIIGDCAGNELFLGMVTGTGDPFLPGSSIKGSLRGGLFHHYFNEKGYQDNKDGYRKLITQRNGKPKPDKFASQDLQTELLVKNPTGRGGNNPNYDLGRLIRPGDAVFGASDQEVYNVAVVNETRKGFEWKILGKGRASGNTDRLEDATKVAVAGIRLGEDVFSKTSISIDGATKEAIKWKDDITFRMIAGCCNRLSIEILEEELIYFEDAAKNIGSLSTVIDELTEVKEEIEDMIVDNKNADKVAWIQRMGWGSGWLSMTAAHATHENELLETLRGVYTKLGRRDMDFPKSRKVVLSPSGSPQTVMGWLMVQQK